MCTVTYIPLRSGGFIITHNRDEKLARLSAYEPASSYFGLHEVTYPKDPQGQGTWIASSDEQVVCLLNGAYAPFVAEESYRHSRGLVVLDVFKFENEEAFAREYNFFGLAPFTLIIAAPGSLRELRWTGTRLHRTALRATLPAIWSSPTLYTHSMQRTREGWLAQWLQHNPEPTPLQVMEFHEIAGDGDLTTNLVMQRGDIYRTVSITQVVHQNQTSEIRYHNLAQEHSYHTLSAQGHTNV